MDLEELVKGTAEEILAQIKNDMGDAWEEIGARYRAGLERAAKRAAKLMHRQLAGEDVSKEWLQVEAQIGNWTFAAALLAKRRFWESIQVVARRVGQTIGTVAKGALTGLV